jgi:hypothetical protein
MIGTFILLMIIAGIVSVLVETKNVKFSLNLGSICGFIGFLIAYFGMFAFVGPFFGLGFPVCLALGIGLIGSLFYLDRSREDWSGYVPIALGIFLFVGLIFLIGSEPLFQSANQAAMVGKVEIGDFSKDMSAIDQKHIRVVSEEQARWLSDKRLGEIPGAIGSKYHVGDMYIQRVKGELYWVGALEFNDFSKWFTYGHTIGYVMVSAEDRERKVEITVGHKFRYMPSAFFGDNLQRHLYFNGYSDYSLEDPTFEVDENLKPYWVMSLVRPTQLYTCDKTVGVAIVNPETGETKMYSGDQIPDWVDRVIPTHQAFQYLEWYGYYSKGWINSWWQQDGVIEPTSFFNTDIWMIYGNDGQPYWFTGMTSVSATDQALCSFALINSRTGQTKIFPVSGANETAIVGVVNSAVSNFQGFRGTQPIIYNVYNEPSWVVPVVKDGVLQRVAIVRAANSTVALGNDKLEALRKYREVLSSGGKPVVTSGSKEISLTAVISRMAREVRGGDTTYILYFEEYRKVFTGNSRISQELPLAKDGDKVTITFVETGEDEVSMQSFNDHSIDLPRPAAPTEVEKK